MRALKATLVMAALIFGSACGGDTTDPGDDDGRFTLEVVVGSYVLLQVDGLSLPTEGGTESGTLLLQSDGTYTVSMTENGEVFAGAGTFTLAEPNVIQFVAGCCDIFDDFTGTVEDINEILVTADDVTSLWKKGLTGPTE